MRIVIIGREVMHSVIHRCYNSDNSYAQVVSYRGDNLIVDRVMISMVFMCTGRDMMHDNGMIWTGIWIEKIKVDSKVIYPLHYIHTFYEITLKRVEGQTLSLVFQPSFLEYFNVCYSYPH